MDETLRHSVSKMANIHFVANEDAKQRLLSMGEDSKKEFLILAVLMQKKYRKKNYLINKRF